MQLAKVAAQRALLSTIPDHVMRELDKHAEEAKAEAEKLKVRGHGQLSTLRPSLRVLSAGFCLQGTTHVFYAAARPGPKT